MALQILLPAVCDLQQEAEELRIQESGITVKQVLFKCHLLYFSMLSERKIACHTKLVQF